jgi:biopolymer transport protein ExbB
MLDFIKNHWYFAIPMFGMTFAALTLVVWRILLNLNAQTNMNEFLPVFQEKLEKEGVVGALRYCQTQPGVIPRRLFAAGLEVSKQGLAAMRRAMANVIELEILPDLNFLLPSILAIAKIATMVGLLGTVISMINTFSEIGKAVEANPANPSAASGKSREIGLALYATAVGLVTAIPLVFGHVLFKAWVAKFEVRMKNAAQKLLILVQAAKPATAAVPAAAAAKPAPDTNIAVRR